MSFASGGTLSRG